MAIVGLDVGYGWTKRYTRSGGSKFPTNVRPFREEKALGEADFVEVNGKKYEIGVMEGITETRDRQFFLSDEFLAVVFYALKDYNEEVRLGIGLPPAWLDIREEVAKRLTGVHEFYYHGKKKLRIQAYVFPQGWGGYIDHIYNLDGRYLANKDIPALFVDVGYYTLDTILTEMVWKGTKPVIKPKKTEEPTLPFGISR
ncbi:hypothetical protein, partial [Desulfurobacterium sp.]|uniref:ParM/StbA family protein n=1 Tax=Desulfurobacterium sp. TaxID=2004706 RepID=UPI002617A8F0